MKWMHVILGGICGVVATGPMTAAMVLWHRHLPAHEKYPLPPREITGEIMAKSGVSVGHEALSATTLVAHFAYGGAAGAIYGLLPPRNVRAPIASGVVVGLCVWALSYLGLLPALGILRPAGEHPARRNALMLGAHFIWGGSLCALHRLLLEDDKRSTPALRRGAVPERDTQRPLAMNGR